MKPNTIIVIFIISCVLFLSCIGTESSSEDNNSTNAPTHKGNIFLYGEQHANEAILKKEIELWGNYYQNDSMRHLFIEQPYYTAQFLNRWIQSESDQIINELFNDWKGTPNHHPAVKQFFKSIKQRFPETIFHGTDVGHQYNTTGKRYLDYLKKNGLVKTEQCALTIETIKQGEQHYKKRNKAFREDKMTSNFIRELKTIGNQHIMGIYGLAHTGIDGYILNPSIPSMANRLNKHFPSQLRTVDLLRTIKDIPYQRIDSIAISNISYKALYYGKENLKGYKNYAYRKFWKLKDAYNDVKDAPKTGDVLPYSNFPMNIETGQVFVIDYIQNDSTTNRTYFRTDGDRWKNRLTAVEF